MRDTIFAYNFPNLKTTFHKDKITTYLLAVILIALPFKLIYSTIATIVFVLAFLVFSKKKKFSWQGSLLFPIALYAIMALSLVWSTDFQLTFKGLQKEFPFFIIPLVFLFFADFDKEKLYQVIKIYSWGMVFYACYSFSRAFYRFYMTADKDVFVSHNLVTIDLNAIYIALFASFCLFYFVSLKGKRTVHFIAIYLLLFFVFLLSSKLILFIDILLIIWYYLKFSKTKKSVKWASMMMVGTFVFLSFIYVEHIRNRFLEEYETAFVDNTVNKQFGDENNKVYNISLKQVWENERFSENSFFHGTAYRVFQLRIFKEMLEEQKNLWLTGFGQDASENSIRLKNKEYHLFKELYYFNFHNQYVQIFAELGVFGFLAFLIMNLINLKNAFSRNDFLHTVFALSTALFFLTESPLCRQRGILFFIVLYCAFNSIVPNNNKRSLITL